jgi:hypothetical protein
MTTKDPQPRAAEPTSGAPSADRRPAYEPPRIVKKRSVSRVTLFTGGGPPAGGLPASG